VAEIRLEQVTKRFGRITAVNDLSLHIQDGEFFTLLGPPGAGKTTTLRLIVGLEKPESGAIYIDGENMAGVHPGQRDIAMIFQNLALYPDKTVFENIAFPLRERKVPEAEIRARVQEVARVLHIERLLDRLPARLSGGERQRVAIGRAIVRRPRAYLMDEPLANLDALLRLEMRVELKRMQRDLGQTLVYVTHDQVEAMSMSDRIAVLRQGVLQQCDTPDVVYHRPANRFVATVVGSPPMNFLPVQLVEQEGALGLRHPALWVQVAREPERVRQAVAQAGAAADRLWLGIRPEHVAVRADRPAGSIPATVLVTEPLGAETIVDLRVGSELLKAVVPPHLQLREGQAVGLQFDPAALHLLDQASERVIFHPLAPDVLIARGANGQR